MNTQYGGYYADDNFLGINFSFYLLNKRLGFLKGCIVQYGNAECFIQIHLCGKIVKQVVQGFLPGPRPPPTCYFAAIMINGDLGFKFSKLPMKWLAPPMRPPL